MFEIKRYTTSEIADNSGMYNELKEIVGTRYATVGHTLRYALDFSTDVYCAFHSGHCCSFLMTAYKKICIDDTREIWSLYLGLTARMPGDRYKTAFFQLMKEVRKNALAFQNDRQTDIAVWATTSSPLVFSIFHSGFKHAEPAMNGTYSEKGEVLARAIIKQYYPDLSDKSQHPFVLRKQSKTLYDVAEHDRLQQMSKARGYSLFRELNIDDAAGDRILMTGWLKPETR